MSLPFVMLPTPLLKDKALSAVDVRVAALLMEWTKDRATGWALNEILAERAGLEPRTVQRSLRHLAERGWIRCESKRKGKSRREITLLWRLDGFEIPPPLGPKDDSGVALKDDSPVTPAMTPESPNIDRSKQREKLHNEPNAPAPVAPRGNEADAGGWPGLSTDPEPPAWYAQSFLESAAFVGLPREHGIRRARENWAFEGLKALANSKASEADDIAVAGRLSLALDDAKSLRFYRKVCGEVRTGKRKLSDVLWAFSVASSQENIGRRGAYFAKVLKNEVSPDGLRPEASGDFFRKLSAALKALPGKRTHADDKVAEVAAMLAEGLRERDALDWYVQVCRAVCGKAMSPEPILAAYLDTITRSAEGGINHPGGYFRSLLQHEHERWESGDEGRMSRKKAGVAPVKFAKPRGA